MTSPAPQSGPRAKVAGGANSGRESADRFEEAVRRAKRHSRVVRGLKFALPALALLLVAGFVARSYIASPGGASVDLGVTAIRDGRLVMSNPRMDGYTSDRRPYTMRAREAVQDIGEGSLIELYGIDARIPVNADGWAEVDADTGLYDRDANTLDLSGNLMLTMEGGVTARLSSARVDIGKGELSSAEPVSILMDGARIEADTLQVSDRGAVMVFEKRVRMEIDGERIMSSGGVEGGADAH